MVAAGCTPRSERSAGAPGSPPAPRRRATTAGTHPAALVGSWRLIDLTLPNAPPAQEASRRKFLNRPKTLYTFAKDGSATAVTGSGVPTRATWEAGAVRLRIEQPIARKGRHRTAAIVYRYRVEDHGRQLELAAASGAATLVFKKD